MRKLIIFISILFITGCKTGNVQLHTSYRNNNNDILTISKDSTFKIQRFTHSLISKGSTIGRWRKEKNTIFFENILKRNNISIEVYQKNQQNDLVVEVVLENEYRQAYKKTVDFYIKLDDEEIFLGSLMDNKNVYNFSFDKDYTSFQIIAKYKKDKGLIEITRFDSFKSSKIILQKNKKLYCKLKFRFDYFDLDEIDESFCKSYKIRNSKLRGDCQKSDNWVLKQ